MVSGETPPSGGNNQPMEAIMECHICGTTEELEVYGEFHLCPECRDEHLKQCSDCGEYFIDNENDYVIDREGNIYCESCRENLSYCEHCEEFSSEDDFVHIVDLDEYWCDSCAENHAYHCDSCGDWTSENCGDSDTTLCQGCFEADYYICDDCGELVHNSDAMSDDDGTYCRSCYESNHSNDIHNYSYEPYLNFLSSDKDDEKCLAYLGFELEAGGVTSSERNDIADEISDGEDTFYLKEDGSIPEYGFELVSHPITLKRHKELDWAGVLRQMSNGGMKSHDLGAESCGLHVHVSRNYLSSYKWLLIDWFISKYQSQFELIARRKETHWARFKKSNGLPVKDVYGKSSGTRYQAVNFENANTVEFRLFRGTLKYSTFMATLEIVDALVHWAGQVSISDILSTGDAFQNFTAYIRSSSLYENAVNYLNELNLMEVKKCA